MICNWCNGTYTECGCGVGHCDHCNHGVVTDPPYGPLRSLRQEGDFILSREDFDKIDWDSPIDISKMAQEVAVILESSFVFSAEEIQPFVDYWNDNYRNETIGDVLQRIALFIKDKEGLLQSV